MKDQAFRQIDEKYSNNRFSFNELPPVEMKVVYLPSYDGMIYMLHDGAYEDLHFQPGDIMVIKKLEKVHPDHYSVFVKENNCIFSPAELVPAEYVDEVDIKIIKEIYQQKLKEKLEKEKEENPKQEIYKNVQKTPKLFTPTVFILTIVSSFLISLIPSIAIKLWILTILAALVILMFLLFRPWGKE